MNAPPGLASSPVNAPGMPPPGMQQSHGPQHSGRPMIPADWNPGINTSASVIRLGTTGPPRPGDRAGGMPDMTGGNRGRAGLGMDQHGQGREGKRPLMPLTKEEIARTVYVGRIPKGVSDETIERLLRCAGALRNWERVLKADGEVFFRYWKEEDKWISCGYAEYQDAPSLENCIAIFTPEGPLVPVMTMVPGENSDDATMTEASKDQANTNSKVFWEHDEPNPGKESWALPLKDGFKLEMQRHRLYVSHVTFFVNK
jgi:hypothetical protein